MAGAYSVPGLTLAQAWRGISSEYCLQKLTVEQNKETLMHRGWSMGREELRTMRTHKRDWEAGMGPHLAWEF